MEAAQFDDFRVWRLDKLARFVGIFCLPLVIVAFEDALPKMGTQALAALVGRC